MYLNLMAEYLMTRIVVNPETACWVWEGAPTKDGYGQAANRKKWEGKRKYAHRVSYECFVGPIPEGLEIDHLCRNRRCCNPSHLEPVTRSINNIRGLVGHKARAINLAKTHCPQGHSYSGKNLYLCKKGFRHCNTCFRERTRAYRAKQKESKICQ